jgi:hypothetical protein
MARRAMSRKVKFRNQECDTDRLEIDVVFVGELFHAIPEVATPLACDVVRQYDTRKCSVVPANAVKKHVVHIDVPNAKHVQYSNK